MKTKLLILFIVFILQNINELSINATDNSCLTLVYPNETPEYYNPDSVMVDTCRQSANYLKWYAKRTYVVSCATYIWGNHILKIDSIYTWRDIDTSFTTIIEGFENIELIFGPFTIKRSDMVPGDSLFLIYPVMEISFNNYFLVDSVSSAFGSIEDVGYFFLKTPPIANSVISWDLVSNEDNFEILNIKNGKIILRVNNNSINKNQQLVIYNIFGQMMLSTSVNNSNEIIISIPNLTHGVYIITFGKSCKKIII